MCDKSKESDFKQVYVYPDNEVYEYIPDWKSDDYEVRLQGYCEECDSPIVPHYLPPMLFKPNRLKDNFTSPYLTLDKDCLILGRGNAHTGDLCLDVLNIQNSVELKLDYEFIQSLEETPPSEPDTDQILNWKTFLKQSKEVYDLVHFHGDEFFMPYKVDKRGRIYSLGYHINPQGYAYKKAMIELANPEFIEVPL